MGSTLNLLKSKLSFALGTTQTSLYTVPKRVDALNKAMEHIIQLYPVPQYIVETTLSFIAGSATLPTDFVRCWKLFDPNMQTEYMLVQPNDFDGQLANTFTIKWDTTVLPSGAEVISLYPADTIDLTFRYAQMPIDMVADSDTIRLPERWDDGLVELAARFLFHDARQYDAEQAKEAISREHLSHAWQIENMRFEDPRLNRLESMYDTVPMFKQSNDNWRIV